MVDAPSIIVGSIVGAAFSQTGLFAGAIVGGLLGVVVATFIAARLGLVPSHRRHGTAVGGMIGFVVAAVLAVLDLQLDWTSSPVGPAIAGVFVPLGAVIGSRSRQSEGSPADDASQQ